MFRTDGVSSKSGPKLKGSPKTEGFEKSNRFLVQGGRSGPYFSSRGFGPGFGLRALKIDKVWSKSGPHSKGSRKAAIMGGGLVQTRRVREKLPLWEDGSDFRVFKTDGGMIQVWSKTEGFGKRSHFGTGIRFLGHSMEPSTNTKGPPPRSPPGPSMAV